MITEFEGVKNLSLGITRDGKYHIVGGPIVQPSWLEEKVVGLLVTVGAAVFFVVFSIGNLLIPAALRDRLWRAVRPLLGGR